MGYAPPVRGRVGIRQNSTVPHVNPLDAMFASQEIFKVLEALRAIHQEHSAELEKTKNYNEEIGAIKSEMASIKSGLEEAYATAQEKARTIAKGDKGDAGDAAVAPTVQEIVDELMPKVLEKMPAREEGSNAAPPSADEVAMVLLPALLKKLPKSKAIKEINIDEVKRAVLASLPFVKSGEDSGLDIEKIIEALTKSKRFKIEHIDGLALRLKNIEYKAGTRPYLHGGGGSGGLNVLPVVSGAIDDSNKTFTFATTPTLVVVNGTAYRNGHGVTITTITAVLDNPVGATGDIYALG